MTGKIEKMDLTSLSKKELAALAESLSQGVFVLNGLWFKGVELKLGLEEAERQDEEVWRVGAHQEAKRLKKVLNIPDGLAGLVKAFNFHVMFLATDFEVYQPSDGVAVFTVTNCKPQQARIRNGLGEHPCKGIGIACMNGFATGIDPRAKVKCLLCPPDPHPDNVWCKWEFTIE